MIEEKEQIIAAAREEAAAIVSAARRTNCKRAYRRCEIVREAEVKANELKELAQGNAKEIVVGAREYADDILQELETYFSDYLKMIRKNRAELSVEAERLTCAARF